MTNLFDRGAILPRIPTIHQSHSLQRGSCPKLYLVRGSFIAMYCEFHLLITRRFAVDTQNLYDGIPDGLNIHDSVFQVLSPNDS